MAVSHISSADPSIITYGTQGIFSEFTPYICYIQGVYTPIINYTLQVSGRDVYNLNIEMYPDNILSFLGDGDRLDVAVFELDDINPGSNKTDPLTYVYRLVADGELTHKQFNKSGEIVSMNIDITPYFNMVNQSMIRFVKDTTHAAAHNYIDENKRSKQNNFLSILNPHYDFFTAMYEDYSGISYNPAVKKPMYIPTSAILKEAIKYSLGVTKKTKVDLDNETKNPDAPKNYLENQFSHRFLLNTGLLERIAHPYSMTNVPNFLTANLGSELNMRCITKQSGSGSSNVTPYQFIDRYLSLVNQSIYILPNAKPIFYDEDVDPTVTTYGKNVHPDEFATYFPNKKVPAEKESQEATKAPSIFMDKFPKAIVGDTSQEINYGPYSQKLNSGVTALLPQIMILPNTKFGIIPKSNVIFDNQILNLEVLDNIVNKPNIAYMLGEKHKIFSGEKINTINGLAMNSAVDATGLKEKDVKDFLDGDPEMSYKGPVVLDVKAPEWLHTLLYQAKTLVQKASKSADSKYKKLLDELGTSETIQTLLQQYMNAYVKTMLLENRYIENRVTIQTKKMPYLIPGFDCVIMNRDNPGLSYIAHVEGYAYSSVDQVTDIQLSYCRPVIYELTRTFETIYGESFSDNDSYSFFYNLKKSDEIFKKSFGCGAVAFGYLAFKSFLDDPDFAREHNLFLPGSSLHDVQFNSEHHPGLNEALNSYEGAQAFQKRDVCTLEDYCKFRLASLKKSDAEKNTTYEDIEPEYTQITSSLGQFSILAPMDLPVLADKLSKNPTLPFDYSTLKAGDVEAVANLPITDNNAAGTPVTQSEFIFDPTLITEYNVVKVLREYRDKFLAKF